MCRFSIVAWWLVTCLAIPALNVAAQEAKPAADKTTEDPGDSFEDEAEPIEVKTPPTTGEANRIKASAFFAHGRVLIQRGDLNGGLRRIQRAWRYDPNLVPIWEQIVPLAQRTERFDELARYAVLAAEDKPRSPDLMLQLAAVVADRGERKRAVALYEAALQLTQDDKLTADRLVTYWEMARLSLLAGDHEKAAKYSHKVQAILEKPEEHGLTKEDVAKLLKDPNKTYLLFAESYLTAGEFADAKANYQKVLAQDEAQWIFQQARILAMQEKYEKANQKLQKYFESKSTAAGPAPYRLLNDIAQKTTADPKVADEQVLTKLVALQKEDPGNTALGYLTAHQLLKAGKTEEAAAIFNEIFALEPSDSGYVGLIQSRTKLKQAEPLLKILAQATDEFETPERFSGSTEAIAKDQELLEQLAALARQQKDAEDPIEHAALAVAWVALQGNQIPLADELFTLALEEKGVKKSTLLQRYGLKMYIQEQYDRAEELLRELLQEKLARDLKEQAYFYLSRTLERAGKTEEALKAAKRGAVATPTAMMRSQIGWILYHAKQYAEAEQEYVRLLKRYEQDKSPAVRETLKDTRMILSNICVSQKKMPEAEEWLEQVLDEFPEDIGAQNDLGYLWADQDKNLEMALSMTQNAVAKEPENYAYRDSLGWTFYRLGRYEEAARELEQASGGENPDSVVLDHLADVYLQMDRQADAVKTWKRALEAMAEGDDPELRENISQKIKQQEVEKASD